MYIIYVQYVRSTYSVCMLFLNPTGSLFLSNSNDRSVLKCISTPTYTYMCTCVYTCVRTCIRTCVRTCIRTCVLRVHENTTISYCFLIYM